MSYSVFRAVSKDSLGDWDNGVCETDMKNGTQLNLQISIREEGSETGETNYVKFALRGLLL